LAKKLLNLGSVVTGHVTPAEHEVNKMNPIGMKDGERFGTPLGVRARLDQVMTELSEQGLLKI